MKIIDNFEKNNLHHAYLIEGDREEVIPEILSFINSLGIETSANPDFYNIFIDTFKIDDARNLKVMGYEKSFSTKTGKKIFIISVNNFLPEAQNTLLKMFEDPIENTHFFIIIPNIDFLLKTLISRFYLIRTKHKLDDKFTEVEKFISYSIDKRISFTKELLKEDQSDELNNARFKALKFLNTLEYVIHQKYIVNNFKNIDKDFFSQIFKAREFINQPGSSIKNLLESVALAIPNF